MTKIKKDVARECEGKASAEICRDREACDASASFKEGRRGRAVRQGVDADPDIVQLDNIVEMRALAEGEGILGDGEFLLLVLVAVVCVLLQTGSVDDDKDSSYQLLFTAQALSNEGE